MEDLKMIIIIAAIIIWGISFAIRKKYPKLGKIMSYSAIVMLIVLVILKYTM